MIQKVKIPADIVLLISRLIIGGIFIFSAYLKISDMAFTVASFNAINIPTFLAYIVSYGEMIFGIALVLGVCMSLSTLFLTTVMIFAVYFTYPLGFQMYSLPLAVLAGTLALHATGAGKWALPVPEKCK